MYIYIAVMLLPSFVPGVKLRGAHKRSFMSLHILGATQDTTAPAIGIAPHIACVRVVVVRHCLELN